MSSELYVTGESLVSDLSLVMCDACGEKLRFVSKKSCGRCSQYFCSKCIAIPAPSPSSPAPKNQHLCRFCLLHRLEVIERSHLVAMAVLDLKYYARRKELNVPINGMKEQLIDIILAAQAKDLTERARLAASQVRMGVDGAMLDPYVSAYSMMGRGEGGTPGVAQHSSPAGDGVGRVASDSDMPTSTPSSDRKRAREHIDLSQVMSLDALTHESQISELGVKQLKTILLRNCINYRGCVEKRELLEKVVRLWQAKEEEKIRQATIAQMGDIDVESEYLCKVCMDSPVDCVLLECGHMLTCVTCGRQLSECPICRQYVTRVVHAFRV